MPPSHNFLGGFFKMANKYTVTKEINGRKIVAKFSGISTSARAADTTYIDGTDNTSIEKLTEFLFDNVIVEPRLSIEDFGADMIGKEVTKTIGGVEYVAKFNGLLTAIRAMDENYNDENSNTSIEKLAQYLFDNVIVKPEKLTIDDFESMDDFKKVVAFARETMQGGEVWKDFTAIIGFARKVMDGQFRDSKDGSTTRKGSKE